MTNGPTRAQVRAELDTRGVPWTTRMRLGDLLEALERDDERLAAAAEPEQLELAGVARHTVGPVERDAGRDLALLGELGVIPQGSKALEATYRRLARQIDTADTEKDRYGVINAARELRSLRGELGRTTGAAGDDALERAFEALLAQISDEPPA